MTRLGSLGAGLLAVGAVLAAAPAAAQEEPVRNLDLQLFLPPAGGGSTFTVARPEVPRHLTFVFGIDASFANAPLTRIHPETDEEETAVPWLVQSELMVAMGLFEVLELGVVLPVAFASVPDDLTTPNPEEGTAAGLGDTRLELKVPVLRGDLAVSGRTVFSIPSGNDAELLGVGYWTMTPTVVTAYDLGPLRLAGELGYRFRRRTALRNLEQDDELHLAGGVTYALTESFAAVLEAQLRLGVGGRTFESNERPAEADVGVRWSPTRGLTFDVGVGTGLVDGYGAPSPRAFVIVRFATEREPCDAGPEDFDGFEDGDLCADPDNDADGIPDGADVCPNDPEDADGFLDGDGCPDTDNDADGVADPDDACPLESEDVDGVEDGDGCPDPDNDEDGLADGVDECPMEPEDRDDFQDDDGCPEPGPGPATVTVTDTRILISERIYFDFDTDTIRSVSMPLLDQVASVIRDLPANKHVRVEGYTDAEGNEQYNLDLSYRRARAVVEYLAGRGVPRVRLSYVGYGEANPVAPNDSPEGRALNRRVEFTILEAGESGSGGGRGRGGRRRRGQ